MHSSLLLLWPNSVAANEDSLAFTEKLNHAIANLNQRVEGMQRKARKGRKKQRSKNTCMIYVYISLNSNYFVSFQPWFGFHSGQGAPAPYFSAQEDGQSFCDAVQEELN